MKEKVEKYILDSLLGAPPVTLATLKAASSALSSFSWTQRRNNNSETLTVHFMASQIRNPSCTVCDYRKQGTGRQCDKSTVPGWEAHSCSSCGAHGLWSWLQHGVHKIRTLTLKEAPRATQTTAFQTKAGRGIGEDLLTHLARAWGAGAMMLLTERPQQCREEKELLRLPSLPQVARERRWHLVHTCTNVQELIIQCWMKPPNWWSPNYNMRWKCL